METLGCCKLYPEQRRGEAHKLARLLRGGGWNPGAIPGLDRWLSRQNPAYRPVLQKSTAHTSGAFCLNFFLCLLLFDLHKTGHVGNWQAEDDTLSLLSHTHGLIQSIEHIVPDGFLHHHH